MKKIASLILVITTAASSCLAASGPDQKHIEKIRGKVSGYMDRGVEVSVETYDQHKFHGAISEAGPDSFVLIIASKPSTLTYAEVKKIKAPMDRRTKSILASTLLLGGLFSILVIAGLQEK